MGSKWVTGAVVIGLVVGIAFCFYLIARGTASATETLLLSVLLTIFSLVGSWQASHYYSEFSFNRNLRIFALKAAEKVRNLSNELDRLATYLQLEDRLEDSATADELLLARDHRIEAAIHMLYSLKSANDGSLSDWQGVIGEELQAAREEEEETEEELREITNRLEELFGETDALSQVGEGTLALQAEIEGLRHEIAQLVSQVRRAPVRARTARKLRREETSLPCPACGLEVRYKQRPKATSYKSLDCKGCGSRLYSTWDVAEGFKLHVRAVVIEAVNCPACAEEMSATLDPMPGSAVVVDCDSCHARVRVYRTTQAVKVRLVGLPPPVKVEVTEELIDKVRNLMPPQPWPTGATKALAQELGVARSLVARAINELTARGEFKLQIDGKLYEEMPERQ